MATTMVFRKTNSRSGRHVAVTPENSTNRHLSYARIILDADVRSVSFANPSQETGLIVLSGSAKVTSEGQAVELQKYDAIYIPRDAQIDVASDRVDIAEFSSDVSERHPIQVVR